MVVLGKRLQQISPKIWVTKVNLFVDRVFFHSLRGNSQIHPFDLPWQLQVLLPQTSAVKKISSLFSFLARTSLILSSPWRARLSQHCSPETCHRSVVSWAFHSTDSVIAKDCSSCQKFGVRELMGVERQAVWGGGHRTPKILPSAAHPREYKYRLWQQSFMQAQTWRVEQRNPSQHSWHFCFHGAEQIAKDRQRYLQRLSSCVCPQQLVQWVLNSRCCLKTTNLFKNYSDCFKNILFSNSFVLPSCSNRVFPVVWLVRTCTHRPRE